MIDANGYEAVKFVGGEVAPDERIDSRCRHAAHRVGLEEISCGLDRQGVFNVPIDTRDFILCGVGGDVQAVRVVSCQIL